MFSRRIGIVFLIYSVWIVDSMASKAAKGKRAKTRHKISSKTSKVTVNKLLQQIPIGSMVDIKINSSIHGGMPFRRHHGETGKVIGKLGRAFVVSIHQGNQPLELIVGPAHLNISKGTKPAVKALDEKAEVAA